MTKLYPIRKPYHTKHYDMGNDIKVYVEFYGNPKGFPAIYLHGGPGDKCRPTNAQLFNPKKYNIVLMDQRGSGKSTPGTKHNTTQRMIQDMEVIREDMGENKWLVTGGSWGAALAMLYAQAHPKHTAGLILRGFTNMHWHKEFEDCAIRSMTAPRMDRMYSMVGLNYLKHNEKHLTRAYTKKIKSSNKKTRKKYLKVFNDISDHHVTSKIPVDSYKDLLNGTMVFNHYALHDYFLKPNQIMLKTNIKKVKYIPTTFVQGRFDFICPLEMAWEMHKCMPNSKFVVVHGGHSILDKEVGLAVTKASDDFKIPKSS